MNKERIAHSFGNARKTYEDEAPVQRWCASELADRVSQAFAEKEPQNCLEIGCGTGFLSSLMLERFPNSNWTISDISSDMLEACQNRLGTKKASFKVLDGEHIETDQKYDLIVSNLAFQWFENLPDALSRLSGHLKPDGLLFFSTLGTNSFKEWRSHLEGCGLSVGLHSYPHPQELAQKGPIGDYERIVKVQPYDNGLHFLRALKAIGAQQPQKGHRPLGGGQLRKALRDFDQKLTCQMTYDIIFAVIKKP